MVETGPFFVRGLIVDCEGGLEVFKINILSDISSGIFKFHIGPNTFVSDQNSQENIYSTPHLDFGVI